jgi:hypothetical protein
MTMWLPDGWWIIMEITTNGVRFTAGANGLPEIESSSKFRSDREATSTAQNALRSMAYENQDSGWSKFRCHARLPGQTKAFCGARIEDSPNTKHAYSEQCGNCLRIVGSIPDPDEAENDIKKHFRYVSFNSERNPDVNSKGAKIMNKFICQIDGHKKTVTDAIVEFCEEVFEDNREVDPTTITGNAFYGNGMSFSLKDGRNTYKIVYRNSMKVFEFFKESEI